MGVRISPPVLYKSYCMSKIRTYFEETTSELMTKVSWPSWSELQGSAVVVMVASLMIALLIFAMDMVFNKLMEEFYKIIS